MLKLLVQHPVIREVRASNDSAIARTFVCCPMLTDTGFSVVLLSVFEDKYMVGTVSPDVAWPLFTISRSEGCVATMMGYSLGGSTGSITLVVDVAVAEIQTSADAPISVTLEYRFDITGADLELEYVFGAPKQ